MLLLLSFMAGLTVILLALFWVMNHEYAGGLGSRFRHNNTLVNVIRNNSMTYSTAFEEYLCKQFKLRNPPGINDKKQAKTLMLLASVFLCWGLVIQPSTKQALIGVGALLIALLMPYINARSNQQKQDKQLDKEVAEMFEIFNFYLMSGASLEEALTKTSDNAGELLTPYLKKMLSNMMLQSKEEAIEKFGKELGYNQNIVIFASALKQAIRGYEETLGNFVTMQSELYTQLKNEQIEELIMKMPTKFNMVSGLLIIAMIFFLVVPVFVDVFSGINKIL